MPPAAVSLVVATCVFGVSVVAMYAARALPDSHFSADARDVIKLGMALIATLVALVLGLMIATAKGTYDSQNAVARKLSADVLLLDRTLAEYGPEAHHPRDLLRQGAELMLQRLWPEDGSAPVSLAPGEARVPMDRFLREVTSLSPRDGTQEFLKAQALRVTSDLAQARFDLYVQGSSELPSLFLAIVVIWLMILFAGYGLIAARNPTVLVILLAATLSVSGAVFLIQELAAPFGGVIRVSSASMRDAIAQLGG
ncbi:MAG: hypothetical protein JNM75_14800 [Rhodospirillales bacterium]|nr:hypothetical protein [Rhodospirillales bacterium]